jgi:hypothetical protein
VCLLALALSQLAFSQTAKLQGVVTDDSGKPVAGAYAVATLQSPTDHSTYSAVTGSSGDYLLANLKSGTYSLCIQSPSGPHLNPCQWATATQITLATNQTLANLAIAVVEGAILQVRIDDVRKLISTTDDLLLGVYLPSGFFQPMRLASQDAAGRTYTLAVPKKASVRVSIISTHLQLADSKGAALGTQTPAIGPATSAALTLQAPTASTDPPITFTVTGRK